MPVGDRTYGHFDDSRREYVITDPRTPWPWINYLGNQDFFRIISHTGGGYAFYQDARLRRLTRYRYNGIPLDQNGIYFYIREGGELWSPGWQPVQTELDDYRCRHGMGYTVLEGRRNDLTVEVHHLVPLGFKGEIQRVRLKNHHSDPRDLQLFSFVEWALWDAQDDATNFQRNYSTGEVEVDGATLYHKTEYRERRNHYAFYGCQHEINGFETDREVFLGPYGGLDHPRTVVDGHAQNSVVHGWAPIASHQVDVHLEAGATRDLIFVLGYVELPENEKWTSSGVINKEPAQEMQAAFTDSASVDAALMNLKDFWSEHLGRLQVTGLDPRVERMVNTWNPYQCMVTFNLSRSASSFESGIGRGMGFRDSNQDIIGFVHQMPEKARQRILDLAATQLSDGSAYHQFQPLTKKGNDDIGSGFNDDPLWLLFSVTEYVKETGDSSILEEVVDFENDPAQAEPLWEHLKRAFDHAVVNTGPHGLPLIGRADWNDCLNLNCFSTTPGESFQTTQNRKGGQAESIFIAGMVIAYGGEYARLCRRFGSASEADRVQHAVSEMRRALETHGWDGSWFLRAYDHSGAPVGSHKNEEGRIFIETQGMSVMAGVGLSDGRALKALDSVREHLEFEFGIVLNQPAYTRYYPELGEISTYPPGYKENAGVFCHNNPWITIAETRIGRGARAFETWKRIAPAFLEPMSERHRTEPYVYAQMIAGRDAHRPGEAKNSWLTGAAAWNYAAITRHILGIRPDYDGLIIDPCIPAEWREFSIMRHYRGAIYHIHIQNPHALEHGRVHLTVDGRTLDGNRVPPVAAGQTVTVEAITVKD